MNFNLISKYKKGLYLLIISNILLSIDEVYLAHIIQEFDPLAILTLSLGFTIVFFIFKQHFNDTFLQLLIKTFRSVFYLNLHTGLHVLTFVYAIKLIEPAIAVSLSLLILPLITHILTKKIKLTYYSYFFAVFLVIMCLIFCWNMLNDQTAIKDLSAMTVVTAILLSLVSGISLCFQNIYLKDLLDQDMSIDQIMFLKFILLFVISLFLCSPTDILILVKIENIYKVMFLTCAGTILPLYIYGLGLKYIDVYSAAVITAGSAIFTLFIQLLDKRLDVSTYTWLLVILSFFACIGDIVIHSRKIDLD